MVNLDSFNQTVKSYNRSTGEQQLDSQIVKNLMTMANTKRHERTTRQRDI